MRGFVAPVSTSQTAVGCQAPYSYLYNRIEYVWSTYTERYCRVRTIQYHDRRVKAEPVATPLSYWVLQLNSESLHSALETFKHTFYHVGLTKAVQKCFYRTFRPKI